MVIITCNTTFFVSPYLVDLTGGQLVAGGGGCNEKAKKSGEPERLAGNCWGGGEVHNTLAALLFPVSTHLMGCYNESYWAAACSCAMVNWVAGDWELDWSWRP